MKLLDLTLPTPAENLALDEALLEAAERAGQPTEVLRVWESPTPAVIIGRASQAAAEVELDYCRDHQIPVLRRGSGGAAVVIGPGCLMYAVVLSYDLHPELRMISRAHCFVLQRLAEALRPYQPGVACQGSSDLTVGVRKFSGNSLRCRRSHLLYHGTLLYNFTLDSVGQCLRAPPRQPDYRESREHGEFVCNLDVSPDDVRTGLRRAWCAEENLTDWPADLVRQFVAERFGDDDWNLRR